MWDYLGSENIWPGSSSSIMTGTITFLHWSGLNYNFRSTNIFHHVMSWYMFWYLQIYFLMSSFCRDQEAREKQTDLLSSGAGWWVESDQQLFVWSEVTRNILTVHNWKPLILTNWSFKFFLKFVEHEKNRRISFLFLCQPKLNL